MWTLIYLNKQSSSRLLQTWMFLLLQSIIVGRKREKRKRWEALHAQREAAIGFDNNTFLFIALL